MTSRPRSVPFIVPNGRGDDESVGFTVTTEALELLGKIKAPVAPIAVVGTKVLTIVQLGLHGGWPLTYLFHMVQGGFEVGPTVEACTKGIWLWSEPAYVMLPDGTNVAVLFMDTEGIGAAGATAEHDARIFSLATLLCSVLVYNSVGAVDEEAVQSLSFIANLTKHIQLKSGAGEAETAVAEGAELEDAASEDSGDEAPTSAARPRSNDSDDDPASGQNGDVISELLGVSPSGPSSKAKASKRSSKHQSTGSVLGFFKKTPTAANGGKTADGDSDDDANEADYIKSLKMAQRKKRAAAKRALAARLREEARRAAGVRRAAALDGTPSATALSTDDGEVSTFFPSFLWVLRDFTLDLVDDDGSALTARDYLETCLAQQEGFSTDAQARNRVRRVLTSFFKDRECCTLVRPIEDETKLQMIDTLPESSLRPEFRKQIAELKSTLFEELVRPKTMQGQLVTGRMLAGLAQAYIGAINAHAIPSIGNAWDGVTRVECKEALDAGFRVYQEGMELEAPQASLPHDTDQLQMVHEKYRIAAMDDYESKAVGPVAEKYRRELKDRIAEEWTVLTSANNTASEGASTRIISRIWHGMIEQKLFPPGANAAAATPLGVYSDYNEVRKDLDKVQAMYLAEAKGPAVQRVFNDFIVESFPTLVQAINAAREAESDRRVADIKHALQAAKRDLEASLSRCSVLESQCADLRQERQSTAVDKARAEQEAKIAREERVRAESRIKELEEEIVEVNSKLKLERVAHAQTRVALRTGASSDKKVDASPANGERWASPSNKPGPRPSVDMKAIMGDSPIPNVGDVPLPVSPKEQSTRLRMRPKGAETIAMPTHVEFPQPQAGNSCGAGCIIQ